MNFIFVVLTSAFPVLISEQIKPDMLIRIVNENNSVLSRVQ